MKKLCITSLVLFFSFLMIYQFSTSLSKRNTDAEFSQKSNPEESSIAYARGGRPGIGRPAFNRPALEATAHPYGELHAATIPDVRNYINQTEDPVISREALPLERRLATGNAIRGNIAENYPYRTDLFRADFWQTHPSYYPIAANADVWRAASWRNISNWLVNPVLEDPLYYDNGVAYPQDQEPSSEPNASGNAQQDDSSATTSNDTDEASSQWMSLGVFAVAQEKQNSPAPTMYMQLALNKSGAIGGNLYDTTYDKTFPLVGEVDLKTQRAVWKMLHSKNTPIIETGLHNLTKSETPVKFTFADGSTQNFFLVRVNKDKR